MVFALARRSVISNTISKRLAISARTYSEGAVGSGSQAFNKREKAEEDLYVREHEQEQLKKLRDSLAQIKEQTSQLESQIKNIEKK